MITIKYFLVDSENVNDNWLMLLDSAEPEDQIIVFYTKNSAHMSYSSVIKLIKQYRPIQFEECFIGKNGLDFQLVSYLGYLIKENQDSENEFLIMSNDVGFDCVVNFWKKREISVKRINVDYCKQFLKQLKEAVILPETELKEEIKTEELPLLVSEKENSSLQKHYEFNKEEVDNFINCIGKGNLRVIHETLVHIYGQDQGQKIYKTVREKSYPLLEKQYKRKDKVQYFSDIIFAKSEIKNPGDFVCFLEKNKGKTKNLNSIRAEIVKSYGKTNGMKMYSLFKPYFKIISSL
mgnify:CR=1 FL=1